MLVARMLLNIYTPALQPRKAAEPRPAAPTPPTSSQLMTKLCQIFEDLSISFNEISQIPTQTIAAAIHSSSVKTWAQAIALLQDGIMTYAFGLTDQETVRNAHAFYTFRKLFLMASTDWYV